MQPSNEAPPSDPEAFTNKINTDNQFPESSNEADNSQLLQLFQSSLNTLAHILIGAVVGISVFYAFRGGLPLSATSLHIVLCVIGYNFLMAESILSLNSDNGWSSKLNLINKRRAHWILQIMGSGLAIAGSFIMILEKSVNWNTLHGKLSLAALVFTVASLVNGLASLYATELKCIFNGNMSKLTHICFGAVAYVMATCSLCYGFDKTSFKNWATPELAYTVIAFTAASTTIIVMNPFITFYRKSKFIVKNALL